jgi:hypothetical protein
LTVPVACAGVVAVIDVLLTTVTLLAAVPPKVTVAPDTNSVPVIVTTVPPTVVPELGDTDVIVGATVPVPIAALKVAICITHGPLGFKVALAL